jgi:hypothetical protein
MGGLSSSVMGAGRWRRRGRSIHDRRSVFGKPLIGAEPVNDPTFLQIIRSHFHSNLVSGENVHAVDPHASRQMTVEFVILGLRTQDFDPERGVWKRFFHDTDEFNDILRHKSKARETNRKKPWHPTELKGLYQLHYEDLWH